MSASTLILTSTGVKPIVEVLLTDKLWDGLTWVTHSGVLDKGVRPVVDVDGIELTEDHLVLVRRTWRKARQLASSEIILCSALETGSASLPWSKSCEAPQAEFMASWLHVLAEANRTPRTKACFALVNQHGADCAPEPKHQRPGNLISPTMTSFLMTRTGEDFLTASRRALIDAQIRTIKAFQTMGAEASEYTGVKIVDRFSSIWSRLKVGTTLLWNLIAKKLTTITDLEIFVSSHAQRTHETEERCRVFKTTSGSCENASQNLKPVFDIANAGPNNRFTVVSKSGFLIVHNCGFQGGVPSLVSMAANYGIRRRQLHDLFPGIWAGATEANREYAAKRYEKVRKSRQKQHSDTLTREAWVACALIVRGWRQTNHEIEVSWTTLETAIRNAVREPGKVVTTLRGVQYLVKNGYLWCRLPSGRCIAYGAPKLKDQVWARLRLEDLSWGEAEVVDGEEARSLARRGEAKIEGETSPKVTVLGVEQRKLVRYALYGGLIMENLCLGAEADILRVGMQNCERNARDVVYHCYDELVVEAPFGTCSVEEIVKYALDLPAWTEGLPLGAAGWRGKRYHK